MQKLHLLIIDPQNYFCDLPEDYLPAKRTPEEQIAPALPVPGAHADMQRLAQWIANGTGGLTGISVTLDTHHRLDIAHAGFWQTGEGKPVTPFTQIAASQVRDGFYRPRDLQALPRALAYLDQLESEGRYQLMVWPVHCEIGSWGHNVHVDLRAAYNQWEERKQCNIATLQKGENPWTEHYSAIMAEVPDPNDPGTQLNRSFLAHLTQADHLYIAGEAGSHCVKATVEHIVQHSGMRAGAMTLLTDCISPVSGFETQYRDFLQSMAAIGVRLASTSDTLPELENNSAPTH
jgi:nicotinamidase-related amidase